MFDFVHLHNHSHYSLLDGACRIPDLVKKTAECQLPALALTDHGNLFGAIEFYKACKEKGIKPIIGSEVYVAPGSRLDRGSEKSETSGYSNHLVLLCKNETGYKNLIKLVSIGYLEGFYYKPRIDLEVLAKYSSGLIATSACLKGEVAKKLLHENTQNAIDAVETFKQIFGEDFYLEVQNHGISEEDIVREKMYDIAEHTGVKVIATNDIHYLNPDHWEAHDVLLCLQTGKDLDDPNRMRYNTHQLYYKSYSEMAQLFSDFPEAITNTMEIADKCDLEFDFNTYHLPNYEIPENSDAETLSEYLHSLSSIGLKKRYETITDDLEERLEHELGVISQMGYDGYFLITQDFINFARSQKIPVGPGRGSAAGSLVAYSLGITDLDPIKYDLYFERFLNPERVSMPDIDIDFCYERREEVIDYVKQKYGYNSVCQIITFGTMAARAVIRDVGRVLKMSYGEVDKIAKLIPFQSKSLQDAIDTVKELNELAQKDEQHKRLISFSQVLEGLARHSSTHAAGVVIAPGDLTDYIPLYKTKEGDITTQFEMNVLDSTGMLKMDFLGLRTLTVLQKAVNAIKKKGIDIDLDSLPLNDQKVYELFSKGNTVGVFQFESSGMQEYLKKLKPNCIEDLIAMNALYRPGPMNMINDFIDRKYGRKHIEYVHPRLESILHNTYGVIVYQEQVMRIASDLAGYSLGGADLLRRAMGKKKVKEMERQRIIFIEGCKKNNISEQKALEIFSYMEEFAKYGFNKSHSACYSVVAYQTAFLKVYHPAEFMAATISSEMASSDRVTILLEECRRMELKVLPPDINSSFSDFIVIDGSIRFGLCAVKNVGKGAIESIVKEREENGPFKTIYEICKRVDISTVNRKVFESLIEAGAMDCLQGTRAQLYAAIDSATEFGQKTKKSMSHTSQASIFDFESDKDLEIPEPELPTVMKEWDINEVLNREKSVLGFYLSGHPLDNFRDEVRAYSTITLDKANDVKDNTPVRVCGIITELKMHLDRRKRPMAFIKIEDFTGNIEGLVFSDPYETYHELLQIDSMVVLNGRLSVREGSDAKIIVSDVYSLAEARDKFTKNLCLSIDTEQVSTDLINEVKEVLDGNKGDIPLYINLKTAENGVYMLKSRSMKIKPTLDLIDSLREKIGQQNVWIGA